MVKPGENQYGRETPNAELCPAVQVELQIVVRHGEIDTDEKRSTGKNSMSHSEDTPIFSATFAHTD